MDDRRQDQILFRLISVDVASIEITLNGARFDLTQGTITPEVDTAVSIQSGITFVLDATYHSGGLEGGAFF